MYGKVVLYPKYKKDSRLGILREIAGPSSALFLELGYNPLPTAK